MMIGNENGIEKSCFPSGKLRACFPRAQMGFALVPGPLQESQHCCCVLPMKSTSVPMLHNADCPRYWQL